MSNVYAVIFDMDGVLVDSYHAHHQSFLEMAQPEGLTLSEEQFAAVFGRTTREVIGQCWGEDRFSADEIAALDERKETAYRRILQQDFPAMPGAVQLLRALHQGGFRLAIGSSGPPENVELVVNVLDAGQLFSAVVNGMDVQRGKPDPQVFLIAAERMGVPPRRCAVVEDAPIGVAAAHAAGMVSIGLASTGRTRESLREAAFVVDRLEELSPTMISRLIDGGGREH